MFYHRHIKIKTKSVWFQVLMAASMKMKPSGIVCHVASYKLTDVSELSNVQCVLSHCPDDAGSPHI
jgi:hypothetical protein